MRRINSSATEKSRMVWRMENFADTATVYIYDQIGGFGVTAGDFTRDLQALGGKPIDLHVNSEGGDVFDGLAIYNALRNHSAPVTAYVDSLAASAASFIIQAASKIVIAKTASVMVHEANGIVLGPADDMRKMADLLDDASENIAEIYADRSGKPAKSWRSAMKAETWYRGDEAVKAGLADEVASVKTENKLTVFPDLSNIKIPTPINKPPVFRVNPLVAALSA